MTAVRGGFVLVVVILVGVILFKLNVNPSGNDDDDSVRVTIGARSTHFKPGEPPVHVVYRTAEDGRQPAQTTTDQGVSVGPDGKWDKSLGRIRKGTYVIAWVIGSPEITVVPRVELKLYFDGNLVSQADNTNKKGYPTVEGVTR